MDLRLTLYHFSGRFVQGFVIQSTYPNWPPEFNDNDTDVEDYGNAVIGRSAFVSLQPSGITDIRVTNLSFLTFI